MCREEVGGGRGREGGSGSALFRQWLSTRKGKKLILKSLRYLRRNYIHLGYVIIENVEPIIYNSDGRSNSLFKTCLFSEVNPYLKFAFKINRFQCDTHNRNNSKAPCDYKIFRVWNDIL